MINDRRILKAMAFFAGFEEKDFENIFIILDKMDKIGLKVLKTVFAKKALQMKKFQNILMFLICLQTNFP